MRYDRALNAVLIAGFVLAACTDTTSPGIGPNAARVGTPSFVAVELPLLPGGSLSTASAINNRGQIAGNSNSAASRWAHATRWTRNQPQDLGTLGGRISVADGINARGDVVGYSEITADLDVYHAFLFTDRDGIQDLGTLGGASSGASAINAQGVVVGTSRTSTGAQHAFRWRPQTGMEDLGTLPGATLSSATNINDRGDIVGNCLTAAGLRAVLWTRTGQVIDLGTLPGSDYSEAWAINERGEIAGMALTASGAAHPVRWTAEHVIVDLGVLPEDLAGTARAIDAPGAIVGASSGEDPFGNRAFVWTSRSGSQELPGLPGATYSFALGVNDVGIAVGESGVIGETHAVRWVPGTPVADVGP